MKVALISSPYDLGRQASGMSRGPTRYLEADVVGALSDRGFDVDVEVVACQETFDDEISTTARVNGDLASLVSEAVRRDAFPLVLGGNCDTALGVLAGIGTEGTGIVWFDAHGDFNTPENSSTGYLGGMPLAIATSNGHDGLRESIGVRVPVPESQVVMAGVRAVEAEQLPLLEDSDVTVIEAKSRSGESLVSRLRGPISDLRERVERVYLHLDIDSLDPRFAPGVDFPAEGGLDPEELEEAVELISESFEIGAASLTAFNPDRDVEDRTLRLGSHLIEMLAGAGSKSRSVPRSST